MEPERQYNLIDQTFYMAELTVFVTLMFAAGFMLLGSKRPKDQPYKWYGWVFYAIAFGLISIMFALTTFYR